MFSISLVAAAIVVGQADSPAGRLARYMEGATHYKTAFTVSNAKLEKLADCTWEYAKPLTQKLEAKGKMFDFAFVQTSGSTIFFVHQAKTYLEWPVFDALVPPPPNAGMLLEIYPNYLAQPKALLHIKWSPPKAVTIGGKQVDEIDSHQAADGGGNIDISLFIDKDGRLVRQHLKVDTPMAKSEYTWDFTSHERLATLSNEISGRIPDGYVPFSVLPPYRPLVATDKVPAVDVVDMATGKAAKLSVSGKTTVVVFTAPECAPSRSMAGALTKAQSQYGKDAAFIEVSLGSVAPQAAGHDGNRPLYWDKSGEMERKWGINYTPYVLVVNKDGVIDRGFGGFGPDQEEIFLKTIAAGVKPAED